MEEVMRFGGIGVDAIDEIILIGGSSSIPAVRTMIQEFFHKPISRRDPLMEAVTEGAVIMAAKIGGRTKIPRIDDLRFRDICPFSIGIQRSGHRMSVIIPAGTQLPTTVTKQMKNTDGSKTRRSFYVFEGPWPTTDRNSCIAQFRVEDIPTRQPVDVIFALNSNRILAVKAVALFQGISDFLPVRKTGCLLGTLQGAVRPDNRHSISERQTQST
jgi:molecular chaperone DnaK (HSP70)